MRKKQEKIVITCAVTGGIHTPTMSDALPYTADDIASSGNRRRGGWRVNSASARA